eukprot:NODE_4_length_55019_cov_0.425091.p11 type:complete len:397 gc:universal NODE_4_length_55019_cov_0.425091:38907-37717(-)
MFHSILIRNMPPNTGKTRLYFVNENGLMQKTSWKHGRNVDFQINGTIFHNFTVEVEYYIDNNLMHVSKIVNVDFIGDKLPKLSKQPMQIIIQNHSGYYMENAENISIKSDSSKQAVKCNPETCQKILNLKSEISQLQIQLDSFKTINDTSIKQRLQAMRDIVEKKRVTVTLFKRKIESLKYFISIKQQHLDNYRSNLKYESTRLYNSISIYSVNKQNLLSIISQIQGMQLRIIRDLSFVYHIDMNSGNCFINGKFLPNSVFVNVDFKEISISLGFAAHLVYLLSKYLFIDLKYPILCRGSHCILLDPITKYPDNTNSPRSIKLYNYEGKLDWSVYLLNKDVEQIMFLRGLRMRDLRKTLPNLKLILDLVQDQNWTESETHTSMSDQFDYILNNFLV